MKPTMNLTWAGLADPQSFRLHKKIPHSGELSLAVQQTSRKEFYFHTQQENAAATYYEVLPHANNC